MRSDFHTGIAWSLVATVVVLAGVLRVAAQDEPRWLTLKDPIFFTEMDLEAERDSESVGNIHYSSDRLYLAPTVGLDLRGSIYHPNLLQFDLKGQGGYIEQDITTHGTGGQTTSRETSYLQNYDFNLLFLEDKPYAAGFSAIKTHTFEELDTFNQATVDSQSYGGHVGYSAGSVPFSIVMKHLEENEDGLQYNNDYKQDDITLNAENNRSRGNTAFTYNLGQFNQQTSDITQKETYQYGTLTDVENFGKGDHLNSTGYFNQDVDQTETTNTTRDILLQENLTLRLNQTWDSFWNYNFNDVYAQPEESQNHYGTIGLHNQLFQSLSSEWDIHGSLQNADGPGNSSSADMYGVGNAETYSKRLGDWGHLTIGNTARYDIQEENNSGLVATVANEQHVLKDGSPTFLSQPRVVSVNKVTDPTGTRVYILGIDYSTFQAGQLTQIERIPTSLNLTNGSTVLVNYTVQNQPSGRFSTFSDDFQVRLDLFNGLIGLYSEIGSLDNHSAEDFVLENTFNTVSGLDVTWHWLQTGGSYETESGNLVAYRALSAYQTASFRPSTTATLSLNGRERWSHYPDENLSVEDYTFTTRLSDQLGRRLACSAEAGIWNEEGGSLAQTLFTAGTHLTYHVGKLSVSLSYQFNHQDTILGSNLRNFVSFMARRDF